MLDAQRFRRTEKGICLDHPADDRPSSRLHDAADVLAVASEIFPLVKTGGLADVAGALPRALARGRRRRSRTLIPATLRC